MERCKWKFEWWAEIPTDCFNLNPISSNSCSSDVLFPQNSESSRKMACIVNFTIFHGLTTVTRSFVTSSFMTVTYSFASYSWYILLVIASRSKISTNTRRQLTLYCFAGEENTALPQPASFRSLVIVRSGIRTYTWHMGFNPSNKSARLRTELTHLWLPMSSLKRLYLHSAVHEVVEHSIFTK